MIELELPKGTIQVLKLTNDRRIIPVSTMGVQVENSLVSLAVFNYENEIYISKATSLLCILFNKNINQINNDIFSKIEDIYHVSCEGSPYKNPSYFIKLIDFIKMLNFLSSLYKDSLTDKLLLNYCLAVLPKEITNIINSKKTETGLSLSDLDVKITKLVKSDNDLQYHLIFTEDIMLKIYPEKQSKSVEVFYDIDNKSIFINFIDFLNVFFEDSFGIFVKHCKSFFSGKELFEIEGVLYISWNLLADCLSFLDIDLLDKVKLVLKGLFLGIEGVFENNSSVSEFMNKLLFDKSRINQTYESEESNNVTEELSLPLEPIELVCEDTTIQIEEKSKQEENKDVISNKDEEVEPFVKDIISDVGEVDLIVNEIDFPDSSVEDADFIKRTLQKMMEHALPVVTELYKRGTEVTNLKSKNEKLLSDSRQSKLEINKLRQEKDSIYDNNVKLHQMVENFQEQLTEYDKKYSSISVLESSDYVIKSEYDRVLNELEELKINSVSKERYLDVIQVLENLKRDYQTLLTSNVSGDEDLLKENEDLKLKVKFLKSQLNEFIEKM